MASDVEAQEALYDAVVKATKEAERLGAVGRAKLLIAAAVAYRAAEGGPQVGDITITE